MPTKINLLRYERLVFYDGQNANNVERLKIGEARIFKIATYVFGIYCCRGDYDPRDILSSNNFALAVKSQSPRVRSVQAYPLLLRYCGAANKRHWIAIWGSQRKPFEK